jgi:hypothetical protein
MAVASDYARAAGADPCISVFDELWGYTSERSRRLWDEMVPPPTRKIACRLVVSYAGFEAESELLQDLYKRGMQQPVVGPDLRAGDGILMFWAHEPIAPWQTPAWLEQMRRQLRPNAYLRMIKNQWVTGSESFITMSWWDECVDPAVRPAVADKSLRVWVGVDASVKRDSTAIVAVTWDRKLKKHRLVWHQIFQPSSEEPLNFETTIESTVRKLAQRFRVQEVQYDPYQMQASAQRLRASSVRMVEYPQTVPGLTATSTCLYELIKSRALVVYPDDDIRLAVNRAIALETSRGWRIAKEKQSHKIDVVVALSMAALAAVEQGEGGEACWGLLADGYTGFRPFVIPAPVDVDESDPDIVAHRQQAFLEQQSRRAEAQAIMLRGRTTTAFLRQ